MVHLAPILDFSAANNVASKSHSWRNVLLLHAQIQFHYTGLCSLSVLQHSVWSLKAATLLIGKLSSKGWRGENWLSLKRGWWKRYECLCESCNFELLVNEFHNCFNGWGSAVVKYLNTHPLPFEVNFMLVKLSTQVFFSFGSLHKYTIIICDNVIRDNVIKVWFLFSLIQWAGQMELTASDNCSTWCLAYQALFNSEPECRIINYFGSFYSDYQDNI